MSADGGSAPKVDAILFDAFGTLFDVRGVDGLCERLFPGRGVALSAAWRHKQLQYTWLLSMMGRYEDFWRVTERALDHSLTAFGLDAPPGHDARAELLAFYRALLPAGVLTKLSDLPEALTS